MPRKQAITETQSIMQNNYDPFWFEKYIKMRGKLLDRHGLTMKTNNIILKFKINV